MISVIVVLYNMRTRGRADLPSLSADYQRGVTAEDYEVHVVENGHAAPVDAAFVAVIGPNFFTAGWSILAAVAGLCAKLRGPPGAGQVLGPDD